MRRHVVLVGLPGSGKTSVGQRVAQVLGAAFHDIDPIIEGDVGLSVRQIFDDMGEDVFRVLERQSVLRFLDAPPAVIAPGGGWLAYAGNLEEARKRVAFLVYLATAPETAASRTAGDHSRPLLADSNRLHRLEELLRIRQRYYVQSDVRVPTDTRDIETVAHQVVELARARAGWDDAPAD